MDVFELGTNWKGAFTRALGGTASLLTQFGAPNIDITSDHRAASGAGFNVPTGSSTPERTGAKGEKHGTREAVKDFARDVKDKLWVGKSG